MASTFHSILWLLQPMHTHAQLVAGISTCWYYEEQNSVMHVSTTKKKHEAKEMAETHNQAVSKMSKTDVQRYKNKRQKQRQTRRHFQHNVLIIQMWRTTMQQKRTRERRKERNLAQPKQKCAFCSDSRHWDNHCVLRALYHNNSRRTAVNKSKMTAVHHMHIDGFYRDGGAAHPFPKPQIRLSATSNACQRHDGANGNTGAVEMTAQNKNASSVGVSTYLRWYWVAHFFRGWNFA